MCYRYFCMDQSAGGWLKKDHRRLAAYHATCLGRIMQAFWPNKIFNTRLQHATGREAIKIFLQRRRWRWLGFVLRMKPTAHARIALTWTPGGRRKGRRPKTTWRRTVMEELKNAEYWLQESHKTSPKQSDLEEPRWGRMYNRALRDWVSDVRR